MSEEIKRMDAIRRMKELSRIGIPTKIEYFTLDGKHKICENAFLRHGLTRKQSKRSKFLIAYTDATNNKYRQFHRSLFIKINDLLIR